MVFYKDLISAIVGISLCVMEGTVVPVQSFLYNLKKLDFLEFQCT